MAILQPQTLRSRPRYSREILTCDQAFLFFVSERNVFFPAAKKKDAWSQVREIWKGCCYSENVSNVFRPRFAGEIWKRSDYRSFCICVWTKPASFWKSSILKMFPVYIKTQRVRFQIPRVWRMFSFEERPFSWQIIVDGRPNRRNKAAFSNFSWVVWTRPQYSLLSSITNQTWRSKLLKLRTGPQTSTEYQIRSRDHEVREHIPVPYDNLFQSILSYASRSQSYFWSWSHDHTASAQQSSGLVRETVES